MCECVCDCVCVCLCVCECVCCGDGGCHRFQNLSLGRQGWDRTRGWPFGPLLCLPGLYLVWAVSCITLLCGGRGGFEAVTGNTAAGVRSQPDPSGGGRKGQEERQPAGEGALPTVPPPAPFLLPNPASAVSATSVAGTVPQRPSWTSSLALSCQPPGEA